MHTDMHIRPRLIQMILWYLLSIVLIHRFCAMFYTDANACDNFLPELQRQVQELFNEKYSKLRFKFLQYTLLNTIISCDLTQLSNACLILKIVTFRLLFCSLLTCGVPTCMHIA